MIDTFQKGGITYHQPIQSLQVGIAIKSIVYGRDGRTPHQNYHSCIVKLITQCCDFFAMVGHNVKATKVRPVSSKTKKLDWNLTYEADNRKQMATPKKNVEKTTISPGCAVS